jgi:hypothetical protein
MGTSTMSSKKYKPKGQKKKKSFPWIGLILVILGLAAMFYFIDPPDVNKISKPKSSPSFLGNADKTFKN